MSNWLRVRFYSDSKDPRPVTWPPVGPYWISGYNEEDDAVLIAYVKTEDDLMKQWPEAQVDSIEEVEEINFTSRFPKPEWWKK